MSLSPLLFSVMASLVLQSNGPVAPSYGAPSTFEAEQAYKDFFKQLVGASRDAYSATIDIERVVGWPYSVTLHRCIWGKDSQLDYISVGLSSNNGYICQFDVVANNTEPFLAMGFFAHDGFRWRYVGRVTGSHIQSQNELPENKRVNIEPYKKTRFRDTSQYNYNFNPRTTIDDTPYQNTSDTYRLKSYYDQYGYAEQGYTSKYNDYRIEYENRNYGGITRLPAEDPVLQTQKHRSGDAYHEDQ